MVQKYGLWAAIASIFLLAIVGVRSAATWLSATTPDATNSTTVNSNRVLNGNADSRDPVFNSQDLNRGTSTQNDIRIGGSSTETTSQRNTTSDANIEPDRVTSTFSPLEEAGTYIQRQKRVELDPVVAASTVTINAIASNPPTAAQPASRVVQPEPTTTTNQSPAASQPRPTAPTSQAVPALW